MGTELHIQSADQSKIVVVGKNTFRGKNVTGSGTSGAARDMWIDDAIPAIRWRNSGNTATYQAKGINKGGTAQTNGSTWVNSTGQMFFALAGVAYQVNTAQIKHDHSTNAELEIYSNSARTNLLTTITTKGSTWTDTLFRETYYCRLRGKSQTGDTLNFEISNVMAGYLYTVTGSYTASTDEVNSCDCEYQTNFESSSDDSANYSCSTQASGACQFSGSETCSIACTPCGPCSLTYACDRYKCTTNQVSPGTSDSWSVSVTES